MYIYMHPVRAVFVDIRGASKGIRQLNRLSCPSDSLRFPSALLISIWSMAVRNDKKLYGPTEMGQEGCQLLYVCYVVFLLLRIYTTDSLF